VSNDTVNDAAPGDVREPAPTSSHRPFFWLLVLAVLLIVLFLAYRSDGGGTADGESVSDAATGDDVLRDGTASLQIDADSTNDESDPDEGVIPADDVPGAVTRNDGAATQDDVARTGLVEDGLVEGELAEGGLAEGGLAEEGLAEDGGAEVARIASGLGPSVDDELSVSSLLGDRLAIIGMLPDTFLVTADGTRYEPGDELAQGVVLDAIEAEALHFSRNGQSFSRTVFATAAVPTAKLIPVLAVD